MKILKKNRLTVLFTIVLVCSSGLFAQEDTDAIQEYKQVTFRFVPGSDMFYIPWQGNGEELTQLYKLVDQYRSEILSGEMPVYVDAYSASMREHRRNIQLAFIRANRVKSELITHKGLKEEHFITKNYTVRYEGHKDLVVVTLHIPIFKKTPDPLPEKEPEKEKTPPLEKVEPAPEPEPVPEPHVIPEKQISGIDLRTNLLYDVLLTPTIGVEWRINQHWGVKLDGSYAHWGSNHGRVQKLWLLTPEVRRYMLKNNCFYMGVSANFGKANIYKGLANVISKETGYQGNIYSGGVTCGYRLPLNRNLALDFNIGLGYTRFEYDTFTVRNDVRVYKGRDLAKNFWGPTQAGITLLWHMGCNK